MSRRRRRASQALAVSTFGGEDFAGWEGFGADMATVVEQKPSLTAIVAPRAGLLLGSTAGWFGGKMLGARLGLAALGVGSSAITGVVVGAVLGWAVGKYIAK